MADYMRVKQDHDTKKRLDTLEKLLTAKSDIKGSLDSETVRLEGDLRRHKALSDSGADLPLIEELKLHDWMKHNSSRYHGDFEVLQMAGPDWEKPGYIRHFKVDLAASRPRLVDRPGDLW